MAKFCEWCGGEAVKHRQFYKGYLFCSTDHYSYFRRAEHPNGNDLEEWEWVTKDSKKPKEVDEEDGEVEEEVKVGQETDW